MSHVQGRSLESGAAKHPCEGPIGNLKWRSGLRLKHPEIAEKIKNDRAAREVMGWEGVASQRLQRSGLVRYYLLLQVPQVVDKLVLI